MGGFPGLGQSLPFLNQQAPQQGGPMGAPAPQQMQTPQQAQDPQSAYLARALAAMGQQPQGSAQGLGENLLASALDQYAAKQRQQQLAGPQMTPEQMIAIGRAQQATQPNLPANAGLPPNILSGG